MKFFDRQKFIKEFITKRPTSYFSEDIAKYKEELLAQIEGKSILVIGGGGTIGSSFIKAILPFKPSSLAVVDYSENNLTELTRDLRSSYNHLLPDDYITYPFDFGGKIFEKYYKKSKFDVVACFAAHKHVRSGKDHLAIEAMVRNNVFNTKSLLDLIIQHPYKPAHVFCVSTDKAANPVNVMGATKKIMEKVLLAYSDQLKITTARFANVAFSNGSLLDGFIDRMMKKQPLSSPRDVRRYFVSPEESGQLCLLACILGKSSEIVFPKLDESQMMTFSSIAEKFLEQFGLQADDSPTEDEARAKGKNWKVGDKQYPVHFFKTKTSGEKFYEEFYTEDDELDWDRFGALGVVQNSAKHQLTEIQSMLNAFEELFAKDEIDKSHIIHLLNEFLPDFRHIEMGKSLDQIL